MNLIGLVVLQWRVEASSCSYERVFSYVTATDFGQSTERMCETPWVRCNREAPEDWGPFEVFDELRKTPFRPRKQKERHVVEVEDGTLLGFAAFKDLQVSVEEGAQAEVPLEVSDLWVVGDVYGVALEDEDEANDEEDLDWRRDGSNLCATQGVGVGGGG